MPTIEHHLKRAVDHMVAALEFPGSMAVLHRNALNLAIGHVLGVQNAFNQERAKEGIPLIEKVDGDPKF